LNLDWWESGSRFVSFHTIYTGNNEAGLNHHYKLISASLRITCDEKMNDMVAQLRHHGGGFMAIIYLSLLPDADRPADIDQAERKGSGNRQTPESWMAFRIVTSLDTVEERTRSVTCCAPLDGRVMDWADIKLRDWWKSQIAEPSHCGCVLRCVDNHLLGDHVVK
jgi:hypothetical protein